MSLIRYSAFTVNVLPKGMVVLDALLLITNEQYKNQVEKWQSYLF